MALYALGMMRAVVDAGLHDDEWCRAHTSGYDDLLERLQEWPVETAATITGIDAATIRRIGEEFASTQPSLLRLGVGGQRHAGAPMAYRTIACLPGAGGELAPRRWWLRRTSRPRAPGPSTGARCNGPICVPARSARSTCRSSVTPSPTPRSRRPSRRSWSGTRTRRKSRPTSAHVLAGLRRDDLFTVVLDQFMTDTARFADVVLPVTTQLEHLDAQFSWGHHYITYNAPAIAPLGEAKPNTEVFRLLAAGLGLDDPCFRETDEALLDAVFDRAPEGITLERLRERGWLKVDVGQGPIPHAEGGFGTPDGKVAFRADWLAGLGLDPLPTFDPPAEVADEQLAVRFPLALLTPKTHFFLNSTFANQSRQHRAQPEPFVVVHPDDAAARGIADGDLVRVFNDRGECHLRAHVNDDAPGGVVVAPASWWMDDHAGQVGAQVTTSQRLTVLGRAPTFNDTRVQVAPRRLATRTEEPFWVAVLFGTRQSEQPRSLPDPSFRGEDPVRAAGGVSRFAVRMLT